MADTQSRKYQLTLNNPLDKQLDHDAIKAKLAQLTSADYWCMADEVGLETQTPHTHIYMKQSDFNALLRELRRSKKRSLPFEARLTAAAEMLPKSMALVSRKKAPALLISFINENLEHIHDDDDWYAFLRFLEAIGGFLSIRPATDAVPPAESDHK